VGAVLGAACTVAEPVELASAYPMSTATSPIVLISSTDQPLPQLMLFAEVQVVKVGLVPPSGEHLTFQPAAATAYAACKGAGGEGGSGAGGMGRTSTRPDAPPCAAGGRACAGGENYVGEPFWSRVPAIADEAHMACV